jgi:hypothetical protein
MNKKEETKIRKIIQEKLHEQYGKILPLLLEFNRVNQPGDSISNKNKVVYVYNDDRSQMSPHFHYFDAEKNFNIEIRIEGANIEPEIINSKPRTGVPINQLNTWDGLGKERKALIKWLPETSRLFPPYTNYQVILRMWNSNNPDNQIEIPNEPIA